MSQRVPLPIVLIAIVMAAFLAWGLSALVALAARVWLELR